ncbi:hypothetical protein KA111_00310 [Candidatus Woesebacteria bacterium]|nr:hypothetical protein [Candidatus Woesebacteria bacterium]
MLTKLEIKTEIKSLIKKFLIWRVLLIIPVILATIFLPFRDSSLYTIFTGQVDKYVEVDDSLIYPWGNFDGVHYLAISYRGYIDEGRFLPLYPILIRILSTFIATIFDLEITGSLLFWSGIFLSNLFFFLSLVLLKKLLELDFKKEIVDKAIILILVFPTAFFFVSIYTESLFLFLSLLILLLARKKKWWKAIILSSLLAITRLPGTLILIPLIYEYIISETSFEMNAKKMFSAKNKKDFKLNLFNLFHSLCKKWSGFLKFLITPILLIVFAAFNNYHWQDPFYFVHAHAALGNGREVEGFVFPLITVYRYLKIFLTVSCRQYEFWVALLEFSSLIFALIGLVFAFIKKVRLSYLLFALAIILLPLLSGTLTGFPRYLILAFPIFLGFANIFENKNYRVKVLWRVLIFICASLQFLLIMLFARGWFVA